VSSTTPGWGPVVGKALRYLRIHAGKTIYPLELSIYLNRSVDQSTQILHRVAAGLRKTPDSGSLRPAKKYYKDGVIYAEPNTNTQVE
jgi:hypothetical protein